MNDEDRRDPEAFLDLVPQAKKGTLKVYLGGTAEVDLRDSLVRLLRQLPPRQRAVIVARYWEQLSEAEAAQVLGCSVGTVKSAASRWLRRLRELSESRGPAERAARRSAREPAP